MTINEQEHNTMNTTQRPAEDDQATETPETDPRPDEDLNDAQEDEQSSPAEDEAGGEVGKLRREAAGHRKRLREVEAERDTLTAQRDALAAAVLGDALRGTGTTPELLAADGRGIADFIGEGGLDRAAITAAGREVARKYGVRSPAISPRTGTGDERPPAQKKTWADAVQKG